MQLFLLAEHACSGISFSASDTQTHQSWHIFNNLIALHIYIASAVHLVLYNYRILQLYSGIANMNSFNDVFRISGIVNVISLTMCVCVI